MVKVIRDAKTGRFAGSVGSGKHKVPRTVTRPLGSRNDRIEVMFAGQKTYNPATPWISSTAEPLVLIASNSWYRKTLFQAFEERGRTPLSIHFKYRSARRLKNSDKLRDLAVQTNKLLNDDYALNRDITTNSAAMWGLLHNPNITEVSLGILASNNDPYVRKLVAMHSKAPQQIVTNLLQDPSVAENAAGWEHLSQESQNVLSHDSSPVTLGKLAKNPYVDEQYRVIAALNGSTSDI